MGWDTFVKILDGIIMIGIILLLITIVFAVWNIQIFNIQQTIPHFWRRVLLTEAIIILVSVFTTSLIEN